jgi:CD109 antigen
MAHELAPSARLNVWYVTPSGEIVTDSIELNIDGAFLNEVNSYFSLNPAFESQSMPC